MWLKFSKFNIEYLIFQVSILPRPSKPSARLPVRDVINDIKYHKTRTEISCKVFQYKLRFSIIHSRTETFQPIFRYL